eukprot:TRINITY_DN679_c0_g1_i1.p1 TRINITY_DN679_c0_g1~~TRINITY_DN679_c0_g1_i1.p1  ORF type:complete len:670 (+),score=128.35 TRINITY_DN679_c0_g1_i1:79-2088(+)
MADRVQRMLENQKKREEAQRAKEEAARAAEGAVKAERMAAAMEKVPTQDRGEAPVDFANNVKLRKHFFAPLPAVARGKPTLIGGSPSSVNQVVYCLGNDVILRSLDNPLEAEMYTEHARPTTVARYSPDGKFVASADNTGTVRVWHTEVIQGTINKLKLEKRALGGAVADIAWTADSKVLLVVGTGKEKMGDFFEIDSGAARGTVTGHAKAITSCDFRPTKPFKAVTGSEDFAVSFFEGPPFKWVSSHSEQTNFINCVRYSPDGRLFLSVAQDKTGIFFDGETGTKRSALETGNNGHKGGIYCCSWSPDGTQVLTSSGDKTVKIWDVESGRAVTTFTFGTAVEDMQVGCLWQGTHLVSLALSGHLNYLDASSPSRPRSIVKGHNKSIESVAYHRGSNSIYTGSYDSVVTRWNAETGTMDQVGGDGHKNSVIRMRFQGDDLFTVSMDDTLRVTSHGSNFSGEKVLLGGKPFSMAVAPRSKGLAATGTFDKKVHVIRNNRIASTKDVSYTPYSFAFSTDESELAVGGDDKKLHIYKLSGDNLGAETVLEGHLDTITTIDYAPDGHLIASADKNRRIIVWENKQPKIQDWIYHTASVGSVRWSPNSKYLASGALDSKVIIWSIDEPTKRLQIDAAHHGGVNDVDWADDNTFISVGQDSSLRTWQLDWSRAQQ